MTLYVEGVTQADYIHTYANVLEHNRPTQPIVVTCRTNGATGLTFTDTVQYIVADSGWAASAGSPAVPASFYWLLETHEELRASLASQGIYGRHDLPKYCMQLLSFEQLSSLTGGFGFTAEDTNFLCSADPQTGFAAGVYHDYISGKNLLTFQGTDVTSIIDWGNNVIQVVAPPASQYTRAMTIASHLRKIWDDPQRPSPTIYTPTTPIDWLLTGHSLGGGLAAAGSIVSSFDAKTFNAAGVNFVTVQQFKPSLNLTSQAQLQSMATGLITSYVVNGEVLNYAQDGYLAIALGLAPLYFVSLPASIGTRVNLDSHQVIVPSWPGLYTRITLHSYYVESLLLSYNFPLN